MKAFNTDKPEIDIGKFIAETFKKTISASRSRLIIFCIILFLQFWAGNIMTYLFGHNYPLTYDGLTQKKTNEILINTFLGLCKYLLLIILIIKSPAERTGRRRFAKYTVLLGSFYLWAITDLMSSGFEHDRYESELAKQSFKENSIPIYGKVVFAYYKRDGILIKRTVAIAERVSSQTNGYIVIVQLNRYIYSYPGLYTGNNYFNDYTHDFYDTTFRTNIPQKIPDLTNCRQFIVNFALKRKVIPSLPAVDRYVRIRYDPIKNGIEMETDSASATTPTFDSIPGEIGSEIDN